MDPIFERLVELARSVDASHPAEAEAELARLLPVDGEEARAIGARLAELITAGEVAERGELPVKYGRVAKASDATCGFSIDVVHMSGPGPHHRHPQGEIDFCFALDGSPTFDGRGPGWLVYGPDSQHVPTVAGGEMGIVYLLPQGAIEFTGA
ncbi:hypothetical protein Pla163_16060 [Planctomycetes bacterium Pla163]|uniref:DUF4863 domain-containing protein n=1 Tax=Rohdeia mirabilis TaxID=2528008 RepID=A0A518CZ44_9BACT|nr:hypothetical protein Pla163_16060 [Planctomycetes bacterium Pla163]